MQLKTLAFKIKFKNGSLTLLYKNMKFELLVKDDHKDVWICIKNNYRFIIINCKNLHCDNHCHVSYSINNAAEIEQNNLKGELCSMNEALFRCKTKLDETQIKN